MTTIERLLEGVEPFRRVEFLRDIVRDFNRVAERMGDRPASTIEVAVRVPESEPSPEWSPIFVLLRQPDVAEAAECLIQFGQAEANAEAARLYGFSMPVYGTETGRFIRTLGPSFRVGLEPVFQAEGRLAAPTRSEQVDEPGYVPSWAKGEE